MKRRSALRWRQGILAAGVPLVVLCLLAAVTICTDGQQLGQQWVHVPLHTLLASGGAFAGIFSALFCMTIQHEEYPDPRFVLLVAALLGMGIMDGFHAGYPGASSGWLHSPALLIGGFTLALVVLPDSLLSRRGMNVLPLLTAAAGLFSGTAFILCVGLDPEMEISGKPFPGAEFFTVAGGVGFMTAWLYFIRRKKRYFFRYGLLLANGCFLFAAAAFLFPLAPQWTALWWCWHILSFFSYLLFCAFFLLSCRRETHRLLHHRDELKKTRKWLADFMEHSPSLIAVKDIAGRFVLVNRQFEKYFGLNRKDIIGRLEEEILRLGRETEIDTGIDIGTSGIQKEELEYEENIFLRNENRVLATSRFPVAGAGKKIVGIGYIRTDITGQRELEYQLQMDQKILDNAGEAVVVTDAEAVIQHVNRAYTRITGYAPQEIIGENPRVMQSGRHEQTFYVDMWKQLLETGKWSGEIWDRRKNGEIYQKWLTINAIRDHAGKTINYVGIFTDITEKKRVERQLKNLLFYDPLTNLPNRTLFEELLSQALINSQFHNTPLVLLCIDLNKFKNINSTLGYKAGDDLLVQVSKRIRGDVRATDTVSRLCSDEFVVLLAGIKLKEAVGHLARHILHILRQPFHLAGKEIFIDASIGISMYPEDGRNAETLLRNADTAMHFAKKREQGSYQFFHAGMNRNLSQRIALENRLRRALEQREFMLCYQPKYSLATEQVTGVESLIRWRHPEEGIISPAEFIPIAEESSLIVALGEWGLRKACHQMKEWEKEGLRNVPIAVNLSARQFQDDRLFQLIMACLNEFGITPEMLELEITESVLMEYPDDAVMLLRKIHDFGVRIAIDDFGTGYSSLAYLKKFPVNTLKIDRAFIADITYDTNDAAIVESILAMARSLHLKVIAEGVETKEQADFLREKGCDEVQGYYFSRPLAPEQYAELLSDRKNDP
ncbi:MAG: putative bifunctional diguanylate cyclase/phosphodiesterase [Candidatus Electrothrix sp. YB6]